MSAVQNDTHEHLLEDTKTEAEVARVCAFRTDRQEESRSLDSTHDENRILSRYSIQTDRHDPSKATRIRDLVSMLHPPGHPTALVTRLVPPTTPSRRRVRGHEPRYRSGGGRGFAGGIARLP